MAARPPVNFGKARLPTRAVAAGTRLFRIFASRYGDPLGFGKTPSRFSDPRPLPAVDRFGVLYLGSTLEVCILEAVLRDRRDGIVYAPPVSVVELERLRFAEIVVGETLAVVDLTGHGPFVLGVPTDAVRATDQSLGRQWAAALYAHPARPDGIVYSSRLNEEENFAIFDRAVGKLAAPASGPLLAADGLLNVLIDLRVAITPRG